ncbi:hypothetical protein [Actinomadura rugatobispora]|uniref:Uncharacterized protein n=1 Tax=Actinomadura rugatobispora TaxID=1994 RepID=A0ABW1AHN6_9ACTN|nr:hypothetical protein GCM10010200_073640 [Actinomadura rugatobispora]
MNESSPNKVGGAVVGFLAGGAAGFVATEAGAAFFHFVLDITPDVENRPMLLLVFLGVPVLCALAGAFAGARVAARKGR